MDRPSLPYNTGLVSGESSGTGKILRRKEKRRNFTGRSGIIITRDSCGLSVLR